MNADRTKIINSIIFRYFTKVFDSYYDLCEFRENIINSVIDDIEECADWDKLKEDEVCDSDIYIAIGRVLLKLSQQNV